MSPSSSFDAAFSPDLRNTLTRREDEKRCTRGGEREGRGREEGGRGIEGRYILPGIAVVRVKDMCQDTFVL